MNCENCFCIYEKDGKCVLGSVDHDINGTCSECIYVDVPKASLKDLKTAILEQLKA